MAKNSTSRRTLFCLSLICGSIGWAESVEFGQCGGSTLEESTRTAITELTRVEISKLGHTLVASNGDFELTVNGMKLGSAIVVTMTKNRNGQVLHTNSLKAAAVEELDEIIPRLVRTVVSEQDVVSGAKVGEVSEAESRQGTRRRDVRLQTTTAVGVGGVTGFAGPSWIYDLQFALGLDWTVFRVKAELELGLPIRSGGPFLSNLNVGGNYYFSDGGHSLYVGPRLGVGVLYTGGLSAVWGPQAGAVVGYEFLRNHSATLFIQVKGDWMFNETGSPSNPFLYGVQAGINFPFNLKSNQP